MTCPVCQESADHIGNIDLNRSAADAFAGGRVFGEIGVPVPYRQCCSCGLIFSDLFACWNDEDYARHIYNGEYRLVDPPFEHERPLSNAQWLHQCIQESGFEDQPGILDNGAGNGRFLAQLGKLGYSRLAGKDKYSGFQKGNLDEKYDIVTCFEVLEHTLDPAGLIRECLGHMKEDGVFIFSTLLLPDPADREILDWWYIAPRNGHICIQSEESLRRLIPPGYQIDCSTARDIHTITREGTASPLTAARISQTRPPFLPGEKQ